MKKASLGILITVVLVNWVKVGFASALTLQWDQSSDPEVVSYQLYYGAESQLYTNVVFTGPLTAATIGNLADGATYYFAATSINAAGLESSFSGEVAYTTPAASCGIILSGLDQVYDGTPKPVSVSAQPSNLAYVLTYSGSTDPPVEAGTYCVNAVSTDTNCGASASASLTINKAVGGVQITNLDQIYDGSAKGVSTTTSPPGLAVVVTYNGLTDPPTQAGVYEVTACIMDNNYAGSSTTTLVIEPATAGILLESLNQTYTGQPLQVWAMTLPPGLALLLTYDGGLDWPVGAGTYTVNATVEDPNYTGERTVSMTIQKAELPIILGNLNQVYDGTPKSATASTSLPNVPIETTYNGLGVPPSLAGNYAITSSIVVADNYSGTATGILYVAKAPASVQISNLNQINDGTPKTVLISTQPPGLNVFVTYDGQTQAPFAAGSYDIEANVDDANYQGSATASLTIAAGDAASRDQTPPDAPNAVLTSGRSQSFVLSWPGSITNLSFWQSTDLVVWTALTNQMGASNSIVIPQGSSVRFFRAISSGPAGEAFVPLLLREP